MFYSGVPIMDDVTASAEERAAKILDAYPNIGMECDEDALRSAITAALLAEREQGRREGLESAKHLDDNADWAFEGFNSGDMTIAECQREEMLLRYHARKIRRLALAARGDGT